LRLTVWTNTPSGVRRIAKRSAGRGVLPSVQQTHHEKRSLRGLCTLAAARKPPQLVLIQGAEHIKVWTAGGDAHVFRFLHEVQSGLDTRSGITEN
jgi:hypothetical protein